jgi:hypothetical protein
MRKTNSSCKFLLKSSLDEYNTSFFSQDDHSGGRKRRRKRPKTAKKCRFTAVIFTRFHRISIYFWNAGLRRRIKAGFCRFIVVSGRLRTVLFDLGSSIVSRCSRSLCERR